MALDREMLYSILKEEMYTNNRRNYTKTNESRIKRRLNESKRMTVKMPVYYEDVYDFKVDMREYNLKGKINDDYDSAHITGDRDDIIRYLLSPEVGMGLEWIKEFLPELLR